MAKGMGNQKIKKVKFEKLMEDKEKNTIGHSVDLCKL